MLHLSLMLRHLTVSARVGRTDAKRSDNAPLEQHARFISVFAGSALLVRLSSDDDANEGEQGASGIVEAWNRDRPGGTDQCGEDQRGEAAEERDTQAVGDRHSGAAHLHGEQLGQQRGQRSEVEDHEPADNGLAHGEYSDRRVVGEQEAYRPADDGWRKRTNRSGR